LSASSFVVLSSRAIEAPGPAPAVRSHPLLGMPLNVMLLGNLSQKIT
jgi:hypothetical protein